MYEAGGSFNQARVLCHWKKAFKLLTIAAAGSGLFGTDWRQSKASWAETVGVAKVRSLRM